MSDVVPSALQSKTPVKPPAARRCPPQVGWLAWILPLAAIALMLLGASVAQATDGEGAFNQIWRGVIFTIGSCALAGIGLGAAVIGLLRRRGRWMAIVGLLLNAAFWVLLWVLWT